jgi:hypothetical protein
VAPAKRELLSKYTAPEESNQPGTWPATPMHGE